MKPTQVTKDNTVYLKPAVVNCIYKIFSQQHLDYNLNSLANATELTIIRSLFKPIYLERFGKVEVMFSKYTFMF